MKAQPQPTTIKLMIDGEEAERPYDQWDQQLDRALQRAGLSEDKPRRRAEHQDEWDEFDRQLEKATRG